MIKENFLEQVRELTDGYQPNDVVRAFMNDIHLVTIIGPSGVGKDTVIDASGLPKVRSITTRPTRPSELSSPNPPYYPIHSEEQQARLLAELEAGELIQAAIHPSTGHFYGSRVDGFPSPYRVSDLEARLAVIGVVPDEHYRLVQEASFRSVDGVYVAAPGYGVWQDRIRQAGHIDEDEYPKRMQEARSSLERCLGDTSLHFLLNRDLDEAAAELRVVALHPSITRGDMSGRMAAKSMLNGLEVTGQPADLVSPMPQRVF